MCRFARLPLIAIWSLRGQQASEENCGDLDFPEATGTFITYCTEHRCACERVPSTEYSTSEVWICPGRPDELSTAMKAELIYERSLKTRVKPTSS